MEAERDDRRLRRKVRGGRRGAFAAALAAVATAALVAVLALPAAEAGLRVYEQRVLDGPFYSAVTLPADSAPGDLLRSQPTSFSPPGSRAWKVVYVTADVDGALVPASGVIVLPDAQPPVDGFPVVSWAHPTTGAAPRCAPSVGIDPFVLIEGVRDLLAAGYAVVATDYPGMGIAGPDSYLVGVTAGNSVLDIAVAAHQLPQAQVSSDTLLWGHSQGGQAVLFAATRAAAHAPALDVRAAAVAAPAVDLPTLLADDIDDVAGVTIAAYAFASYADVYRSRGAELGQILSVPGEKAVAEMASLCLFGQNSRLHRRAQPLVGHLLAADPSETEPWAALLEENSPVEADIAVPLFVAQGMADTLVRPSSTERFVKAQCVRGAEVHFEPLEGVGHGGAADEALAELLPWMADVLAGRPTPSNC